MCAACLLILTYFGHVIGFKIKMSEKTTRITENVKLHTRHTVYLLSKLYRNWKKIKKESLDYFHINPIQILQIFRCSYSYLYKKQQQKSQEFSTNVRIFCFISLSSGFSWLSSIGLSVKSPTPLSRNIVAFVALSSSWTILFKLFMFSVSSEIHPWLEV